MDSYDPKVHSIPEVKILPGSKDYMRGRNFLWDLHLSWDTPKEQTCYCRGFWQGSQVFFGGKKNNKTNNFLKFHFADFP